jgi:hypothetical protein
MPAKLVEMGHNNIIFGVFVSVGSIGESIIAIHEFDEFDTEEVMGMK